MLQGGIMSEMASRISEVIPEAQARLRGIRLSPKNTHSV